MAPVSLPASVAAGRVVAGRYRVVAPLGRGGMGAVYEVIDTVTDRVRALKLVDGSADADAKARFRSEAVIAGRVESPHVVDVFDSGYDDALGVYFLVMDRLRGEDLGALLAREKRLGSELALRILGEVAVGLGALHDEGIVHRDLKPENVFLARSRQEENATRVILVDLGLAKSFHRSTAVTTRAVGTPSFMAPEQLRGDATVDSRADVYAFAHLAFALLTGTPYFAASVARAGNLYAVLLAVAEGPRELPSVRARSLGAELPEAFDAWFLETAHAAAEQRCKSVHDAYAGLRRALGGEVSGDRRRTSLLPVARTTSTSEGRAGSPRRSRAALAGGLALAALLAALGLGRRALDKTVATAPSAESPRAALGAGVGNGAAAPSSVSAAREPNLDPAVAVTPSHAGTPPTAPAPSASSALPPPRQGTPKPANLGASRAVLSSHNGAPPKPTPAHDPLDSM